MNGITITPCPSCGRPVVDPLAVASRYRRSCKMTATHAVWTAEDGKVRMASRAAPEGLCVTCARTAARGQGLPDGGEHDCLG